jgi:hypothetical protein
VIVAASVLGAQNHGAAHPVTMANLIRPPIVFMLCSLSSTQCDVRP